MNLIDDATSYSWAIPLPLKSSAIKALKTWVLAVERQTGKKVGCFNIDNGELKSAEFIDFCASRGITPRWTSPHTSAQNGRVERVHRTLNYLCMRVATKTLNNITPYEAYFEHKPDISHLREIGCQAFVLIQNKHNHKVFK
jgi:transposase InsO family protein